MKAYKVYSVSDPDRGSTIVFAESIGKAKGIAKLTDVGEDSCFTDIRVNRFKLADSLYKGDCEIDWNDPDTRLVLVRDFGWYCYDYYDECEKCVAKEYCLEYLGRKEL